ncbi:hypothetical protein [Dactylosporangium cerinum]
MLDGLPGAVVVVDVDERDLEALGGAAGGPQRHPGRGEGDREGWLLCPPSSSTPPTPPVVRNWVAEAIVPRVADIVSSGMPWRVSSSSAPASSRAEKVSWNSRAVGSKTRAATGSRCATRSGRRGPRWRT